MSDRTCTRAPCQNFAVDCDDILNRLQEKPVEWLASVTPDGGGR